MNQDEEYVETAEENITEGKKLKKWVKEAQKD